MWRDALLVAGKDLRVEARSRVATNQVAPFAALVLVLFAFALDPDRGVLGRAAAGLFWLAVLFSALLAVQRSFALEAHDDALAKLELDGRVRDVAVARLSAGQRRRVAIAALVARQPDLWLLDEPHAGLDADGRDLLDGLVAGAAADGSAVLIASHELERAGAIAHRTVTMAGGQIHAASGPVAPLAPEAREPAGVS